MSEISKFITQNLEQRREFKRKVEAGVATMKPAIHPHQAYINAGSMGSHDGKNNYFTDTNKR